MTFATWARLGGVLVVALVFQVALLNQVLIFGLHPDVMVIFPVAAGLIAGAERGATIGFAAGLLADLVVALPYGLSPLTFCLAGFVAGLLARAAGAHEIGLLTSVSCSALAAATTLLYAVIGTVIGQPGLLSSRTVSSLIIVGLGGLVLSFPVLTVLRWCFVGSSAGAYSVPSGGSALV
jgi:rod shape-determining protein MreD